MKKGQSSIEFIMLFGSLFLIFILILGILFHYNRMQYRSRDYAELEDLAAAIKREIEIATQVKDGYRRAFNIPNKIGVNNYTLSHTGRDLSLAMGELDYSVVLPEVTGSLTKGENTIAKEGGVVYVNG
jgi:hypothetical protein